MSNQGPSIQKKSKVLFRDLPDAGLWRRLAAGVYDALLLLAIFFVLGFVAAIALSPQQQPDMNSPVAPLVPAHIAPFVILPAMFLITTAFYGWFWRHGGQTLGMKSWRLRLVTHDDRALRLRDVVVRVLVGCVSLFCGGLGFWWVLVNGRTWHDAASRTRVVVLPKE